MIKSMRMIRSSVLLGILVTVGVSLGPAPGAAAAQPAAGQVPPLRPPVAAPLEVPVVEPFELSEGGFGPGVRGVKLAAPAGSPVAAPAPGNVRFAGEVAGLGWVTLEVAPGVLVSVGPLDRITVRAGAQAGARTVVGRLHAGHDRELHLGLRVDGEYVDPLPHLARVGPPRLVPLD